MSTDSQSGDEAAGPAHERRKQPLCACISTALERYFQDLDGHPPPSHLYELVMDEVEQPLLKMVMQYARGNQSKAAEVLGINRGTLRKRLEKHGLL